jgi:hypothetical protein
MGYALAGAAVVVAGCSGSGPRIPAQPAAALTPTATPSPSKSAGRSVPTQPLTGLPITNGTQNKRPALFVKIENSPDARPQTGLEKADIVYEAVAEGGITRFAAVFQSTAPGDIGPVRSVRPQDADLAAPFRGLAAFSGGVAPIVADVSSVAQAFSDDLGAPGFYRTTDRYAPHNLYLHTGIVWAKAAAPYNRAPQRMFSYGAIAAGATKATTVDVPMSQVGNARWTWSEGAWRRSQDGVPFTVVGTGRVGPANVIIQYVKVGAAGYEDVSGTSVPESAVTGTGRAQLLRDGKMVEGTWAKPTRDAVTTFTTKSGAPMRLAPGRTWVELLPDTGAATVTP